RRGRPCALARGRGGRAVAIRPRTATPPSTLMPPLTRSWPPPNRVNDGCIATLTTISRSIRQTRPPSPRLRWSAVALAKAEGLPNPYRLFAAPAVIFNRRASPLGLPHTLSRAASPPRSVSASGEAAARPRRSASREGGRVAHSRRSLERLAPHRLFAAPVSRHLSTPPTPIDDPHTILSPSPSTAVPQTMLS